MKLDHKGVLHFPLALLTSTLVLSGFALWGILHHWNSLAQTQLRLDRCTGEAALDLKSRLKQIGTANQHIQELRTAEAAALVAAPQTAEALQLAIVAETAHQEAVRATWMLKRFTWSATSGCGTRGDVLLPLPALTWTREPPDELGPKPLRLEELPSSFRIEARHPPRASAAAVNSGEGNHGIFSTPNWRARWTAPRELLLRTSFR